LRSRGGKKENGEDGDGQRKSPMQTKSKNRLTARKKNNAPAGNRTIEEQKKRAGERKEGGGGGHKNRLKKHHTVKVKRGVLLAWPQRKSRREVPKKPQKEQQDWGRGNRYASPRKGNWQAAKKGPGVNFKPNRNTPVAEKKGKKKTGRGALRRGGRSTCASIWFTILSFGVDTTPNSSGTKKDRNNVFAAIQDSYV